MEKNEKIRILANNAYFFAISLIILACTSFGVYQYQEKLRYRQLISNTYSKSINEVTGYVSSINSLLKKAGVLERPEQSSAIYADIWRQAASAHENLAALPYNHEVVVKTSKYLSQVSDFAYSMMTKSFEGTLKSPSDRETAKQITDYSESLSNELLTMLAAANLNGGIEWELLASETLPDTDSGEEIAGSALMGSMINVAKTFRDYPTLIYDGPFSDHIQNLRAKYIEDMPVITVEEGMNEVSRIFTETNSGVSISEIRYTGETPEENDKLLPVYNYEIILDGDTAEIYLALTKQGGIPLWIISSHEIPYKGRHISFEQANVYALKFLQKIGFDSMKYSYYEYSGDSIVINYAPYIDGVIMYPDLIKVKLSLNNGSITGLEALGYIQMHTDRELPYVSFSQADALRYISSDLTINTINVCVIPKGSYTEELCYEFNVEDSEENKYLIYINAVTGKMENIYELKTNDYGVLAE